MQTILDSDYCIFVALFRSFSDSMLSESIDEPEIRGLRLFVARWRKYRLCCAFERDRTRRAAASQAAERDYASTIIQRMWFSATHRRCARHESSAGAVLQENCWAACMIQRWWHQLHPRRHAREDYETERLMLRMRARNTVNLKRKSKRKAEAVLRLQAHHRRCVAVESVRQRRLENGVFRRCALSLKRHLEHIRQLSEIGSPSDEELLAADEASKSLDDWLLEESQRLQAHTPLSVAEAEEFDFAVSTVVGLTDAGRGALKFVEFIATRFPTELASCATSRNLYAVTAVDGSAAFLRLLLQCSRSVPDMEELACTCFFHGSHATELTLCLLNFIPREKLTSPAIQELAQQLVESLAKEPAESSLALLAKLGDEKIVKFEGLPLFSALRIGSVACETMLRYPVADPMFQSNGLTYLHAAIFSGSLGVVKLVHHRFPELLRVATEHGSPNDFSRGLRGDDTITCFLDEQMQKEDPLQIFRTVLGTEMPRCAERESDGSCLPCALHAEFQHYVHCLWLLQQRTLSVASEVQSVSERISSIGQKLSSSAMTSLRSLVTSLIAVNRSLSFAGYRTAVADGFRFHLFGGNREGALNFASAFDAMSGYIAVRNAVPLHSPWSCTMVVSGCFVVAEAVVEWLDCDVEASHIGQAVLKQLKAMGLESPQLRLSCDGYLYLVGIEPSYHQDDVATDFGVRSLSAKLDSRSAALDVASLEREMSASGLRHGNLVDLYHACATESGRRIVVLMMSALSMADLLRKAASNGDVPQDSLADRLRSSFCLLWSLLRTDPPLAGIADVIRSAIHDTFQMDIPLETAFIGSADAEILLPMIAEAVGASERGIPKPSILTACALTVARTNAAHAVDGFNTQLLASWLSYGDFLNATSALDAIHTLEDTWVCLHLLKRGIHCSTNARESIVTTGSISFASGEPEDVVAFFTFFEALALRAIQQHANRPTFTYLLDEVLLPNFIALQPVVDTLPPLLSQDLPIRVADIISTIRSKASTNVSAIRQRENYNMTLVVTGKVADGAQKQAELVRWVAQSLALDDTLTADDRLEQDCVVANYFTFCTMHMMNQHAEFYAAEAVSAVDAICRALVRLQSVLRGSAVRCRFRDVWFHLRAYRRRKLVATNNILAIRWGLKSVQSIGRGMLRRRSLYVDWSSRQLQRVGRGYISRKTVFVDRHVRRLQRTFRGCNGRQLVFLLQRAAFWTNKALAVQRFATAYLVRKSCAIDRQHRLARLALNSLVRRLARGYLARRRLGRSRVRIASVFVGYRTRRELFFRYCAITVRNQRLAFEKLLSGEGWPTYHALLQQHKELLSEIEQLNFILDRELSQRKMNELARLQSHSGSPARLFNRANRDVLLYTSPDQRMVRPHRVPPLAKSHDGVPANQSERDHGHQDGDMYLSRSASTFALAHVLRSPRRRRPQRVKAHTQSVDSLAPITLFGAADEDSYITPEEKCDRYEAHNIQMRERLELLRDRLLSNNCSVNNNQLKADRLQLRLAALDEELASLRQVNESIEVRASELKVKLDIHKQDEEADHKERGEIEALLRNHGHSAKSATNASSSEQLLVKVYEKRLKTLKHKIELEEKNSLAKGDTVESYKRQVLKADSQIEQLKYEVAAATREEKRRNHLAECFSLVESHQRREGSRSPSGSPPRREPTGSVPRSRSSKTLK